MAQKIGFIKKKAYSHKRALNDNVKIDEWQYTKRWIRNSALLRSCAALVIRYLMGQQNIEVNLNNHGLKK